MEYRPLDIMVMSANDLKDVNMISKMDVYVLVSISNDPNTKRKTHVDKDGGKSPKWNHRIMFDVDEAALAGEPNLCLLFKIKSERPLGDKDIGEVSIPIKELLDNNAASSSSDGSERVVDYQVRTPSGKPKGTLKFSYKFGEKFTAQVEATKPKNAHEPVTAYPAHGGPSMAYPPPPPGVGYGGPPPPGMGAPYGHPAGYPPPPGYGYPPPPGYGYPPAPAYGHPPQGYGYPPVMHQQQPQQGKKKKKGGGNFGLGMGAGLLGGLLVGDMISDVGEMAAYDDAGFDF